MLTYVGDGYSPAFKANFDLIAGRLSSGEDILVVEGPDDICAPLLSDSDAHCIADRIQHRDQRALGAVSQVLAQSVQVGGRLRLSEDDFSRLRREFAQALPEEGSVRHACLGCDWASLCTAIATDDYRAARVMTGV